MKKRKEEGYSLPEKTISFYISKIFPDAIESYQAIFLGAREIDVFIPSIQLGIEYDGVHWHKDKLNEDITKNMLCKAEGIELIRVREYGLPNVSDSCKTFELMNRGVNLSEVIKVLLSCIFTKYNVTSDISVDLSRDFHDINTWYVNTKARVITNRWTEILNYYSSKDNIKRLPDKAFIYYGIYDDKLYFNFWYRRNMFFVTVSAEKVHFRYVTVNEIETKVDGSLELVLDYFRVGHFRFEDEEAQRNVMNLFWKIYNSSSIGRYALKYPKKIEYVIDNPKWNLLVELINSKENLYLEDTVPIDAEYSFHYGDTIYGMLFKNKSIVVSSVRRPLFIDDIFNDDMTYNEKVIYIVSRYNLHMGSIRCYINYLLETNNIIFKDEITKEAFFRFIQPFYFIIMSKREKDE